MEDISKWVRKNVVNAWLSFEGTFLSLSKFFICAEPESSQVKKQH